jgi:hypothetical protein
MCILAHDFRTGGATPKCIHEQNKIHVTATTKMGPTKDLENAYDQVH